MDEAHEVMVEARAEYSCSDCRKLVLTVTRKDSVLADGAKMLPVISDGMRMECSCGVVSFVDGMSVAFNRGALPPPPLPARCNFRKLRVLNAPGVNV